MVMARGQRRPGVPARARSEAVAFEAARAANCQSRAPPPTARPHARAVAGPAPFPARAVTVRAPPSSSPTRPLASSGRVSCLSRSPRAPRHARRCHRRRQLRVPCTPSCPPEALFPPPLSAPLFSLCLPYRRSVLLSPDYRELERGKEDCKNINKQLTGRPRLRHVRRERQRVH
ncbi:hypothetical protein NDU88_000644 [Pleurodeles waltl]|uniref:Uncharacterized protein n=1 Tax=Pleurodeles waltl TaxID=8319 RepID=A0AAV7LV81_PLEWA|nr:hypothetical protein NDU88_000644 [Pleurodeles waltl]